MATYRYGKWESWDGFKYFSIERKTLFGWKEEKYWGLSHFDSHSPETEEQQKKLMMESVERLVRAGHTVL